MTLLNLIETAILVVGVSFVLYILIADPGPPREPWNPSNREIKRQLRRRERDGR